MTDDVSELRKVVSGTQCPECGDAENQVTVTLKPRVDGQSLLLSLSARCECGFNEQKSIR